MDYKSKTIRAAVRIFHCRSKPNLSENVCPKSCESDQNWRSYGQKETTYFKEPFLPVPPLNSVIEARYLNYAIINIIINTDDISPERPNKSPILKLNKKLKIKFTKQEI